MQSLRRKRRKDERNLPRFSVRPWGLAGFFCIALSLIQASLIGTRWLTILFSIVGVSLAGYGAWKERDDPQPQDKFWLVLTGTFGGLILLLICFAPGVINNRWAMDGTIPKPDPNELTAVPRDKAMQKGRALTKDEVLDSGSESFRQDDVVIKIESAYIGQVARKGEKAYLQIYFLIVNLSPTESISFAGFGDYQPVLADDSGRSFGYIEQRLKQIKNKSVVFEDWGSRQSIDIAPRGAQELMLIFEAPPGVNPLQLEINSAAWGRIGLCRFRISGISPSKF